MAITMIVEDGTGVVGANSYATIAFADAYFATHPFYADAWEDIVDDDEKKILLISATRTIDTLMVWPGYRAYLEQELEWPRYGVYDSYDVLLSNVNIPNRLRQATCEMAYYLTTGDKTAASAGSAGLTKIKIDVIELDYSTGSTSSAPQIPSVVLSLLRGLGDYVFTRGIRRVVVG